MLTNLENVCFCGSSHKLGQCELKLTREATYNYVTNCSRVKLFFLRPWFHGLNRLTNEDYIIILVQLISAWVVFIISQLSKIALLVSPRLMQSNDVR